MAAFDQIHWDNTHPLPGFRKRPRVLFILWLIWNTSSYLMRPQSKSHPLLVDYPLFTT